MNKNLATRGFVLMALCTELHAGGLERTDQSMSVLFEKGRHLEFGLASVSPDVSGVAQPRTPTPGQVSGNIGRDFRNLRFAFKDDINAQMSYAIIFDEPYGSDVAYPSNTSYFARGASADVKIRALSGVLRYKIAEPGSSLGGQFSVFGGPRVQHIEAAASVPFVQGYKVDADSKTAAGYLAGVAWERPELGMRVSVTYHSEVKASLNSTETIAGRTSSTKTDLNTPQAFHLEAQTGLNPKTLVYGSIRWVPWSDFTVSPPVYRVATNSPLAFFKDDRTTYRIGLGRRISDEFSVFGEVSHEKKTGSGTTNLTPTDGFTGYTLGANYQYNKARYTLAYRYAKAGDAGTILGALQPAGVFTNNKVQAIGVRVSFDLN